VHTARQLDESLFAVEVDGRPATRAELLGEWGPLHRFGVVVHEPFGSVGASYLLQLAITAFYDARPARRSRERPVYPDVFAFHVGGRFGEHAFFDVYGPRKEVFVADDPALVLDAINDRGITHLAVPDRPPAAAARFHWKEPAQALDRLVAAWAYAPGGRVEGADVAIGSDSPRAEANAKTTLGAPQSYAERKLNGVGGGAAGIPPEEMLDDRGSRAEEVSAATREAIWARRAELDGPAGRTETYRRVEPAEALRMLARE
jgi:hypothetical protein